MTERNLVLVVDDDPVVVHLVEKMLERARFRVSSVPSGVEALNLLRGHPDEVALVFVDLAMPGISGVDLAREMKSTPAMAAIPLVAVTANFGPELTGELELAGIEEVIEKPFRSEQLVEVLQRHGVQVE